MKQLLLFLSILTVGFYFSGSSYAKIPPSHSEMIIEIPEFHPQRNLTEITSVLQNLGGITVIGSCYSERCIFLDVNRNLQPDNEHIMRALTGMGYHPELKSSGTIQQAQDACKDR